MYFFLCLYLASTLYIGFLYFVLIFSLFIYIFSHFCMFYTCVLYSSLYASDRNILSYVIKPCVVSMDISAHNRPKKYYCNDYIN